MNDYRAILAVLSLAAGLILLIAAARYAFVKNKSSVLRRKRVVMTVVYAVLFVVVGGLLWTRQGQTELATRQADEPTSRRSEQSKQADVKPQQTERQAAPVARETPVTPQEEPVTLKPVPAEPRMVDVEPAPPQQRRETPRERDEDKSIAGQRATEDRIATVVERAFTVIERFFDRHATPVPATSRRPARRQTESMAKSEIRFPRVTFEEQTAELSAESEAALRKLARDLKQRPDLRLEIQARVDSVGPEAFNHMLTQARATAVRDLLVVEGVPAERLIARGFGSEPIPEADGRLIAFVVRR